ncbi:MAG: glycosyltransferase family 2 protein [Halothece sp.]
MFPKVSILIPCYNAEKWVAQAITSALEQTYPNKEVIVVDDGSTDDSVAIIKSFGSLIHWESQSNQGGNPTRNRLLELSTGEWLQYLDADDYLLPEKIEQQVNLLSQEPEADIICSPAITEYHQDGKVWQEASASLQPRDPWILLAKWALPQTGGSLWCKQALVDVGGWANQQPCCQEHELYSRLLMAGKKFAYWDESRAVYRLWNNNSVSRKDKWEPFRRRLEIKDRIEAFLEQQNQLTQERQNAINQARFACARVIYNDYPSWASQIISQIHQQEPNFLPITSVPKFYQLIYQVLGFSITEKVASFKRKFY